MTNLTDYKRTLDREAKPFWLGLPILIVLAACNITPPPPPYPYYGPYGSAEGVTAEARKRSNALEQYVKDWLDGKASASLPSALIPEANKSDSSVTYTLKRVNEIDTSKQWVIRKAHAINWNNANGLFNDPHATYLFQPAVLVPFGSKIIIEGQFPHARYFSIQSSPSFQPNSYRIGPYGQGEVSWLDADIEPVSGSTNPYRINSDRNARARSYRITCDVAVGDPLVLDVKAWSHPNNRDPGNNNRHCSGLTFRGPWGAADSDGAPLADKKGLWDAGTIWIRYYGPDKTTDALGGVPLPRMYYQLPDGRQYYVAPDLTISEGHLNRTAALNSESPAEPGVSLNAGPGVGWEKAFSILRGGMASIARSQNYPSSNQVDQRKYTRDIDKGVASRGEDVPGIGNREPHATAGVHIHYLGRVMCLGAGKVFGVAGTMPTIPKTRNGEAVMTGGQSRYWSITGYSTAFDAWASDYVAGLEITSIMDDEIRTNAQSRYLILYGRAADRPSNATPQNGVTWVEWGPEACQAFTLRWATMGPEWTFAKAPDQGNVGWEANWASASFDPKKLYKNDRTGFLGNYQPVVSYLTKAQFEALGNGFDPFAVPAY